jgi:competence protein ComEA
VDPPTSAAATGAVVPRAPALPPTRAGAPAPAPVADPPVARSDAAPADDAQADDSQGADAYGNDAPADGARGDGGTLAMAAALLAQETTTPSAVDLTPGPGATLDAAANRLASTAAKVVGQMMAVGDRPTPAPLTPEPSARSAAPAPRPAAAATATPTPLLLVAGCPSGTQVDLNSASVTDLQALPGVGPAAAQRIVDHRQQTPFVSVTELDNLHLVSRLTFARIRDLVTVGPAS